MEVQSPVVKRNYDITMSRRTRKQQQQPLFPVQQANNDHTTYVDHDHDINNHVSLKVETTTLNPEVVKEEGGDENIDHKSLKQLIVGEEKDAIIKCTSSSVGDVNDAGAGNNNNNNNKGRNSLGEHFNEEEKQLQLVLMQQKKDNLQGLKFKKLVRRYAKVLGHLMKAKRDPHLGDAGKKPLFKLST